MNENVKKNIVFVNQSSGYLMVDIINAHSDFYDNISLLTGFFNPRDVKLTSKCSVRLLTNYRRHNLIYRLVTWSLFCFQVFILLISQYRNHSIYWVSNPPLNSFLAWIFRNRTFGYLVYDVYPDVLIKQGLIKNNSIIARIWSKVNRSVFSKSSKNIAISYGMQQVLSKYCESDNFDVVPIWTDNNFLKPILKSENLLLRSWNLREKFIVLYSGNMGKTHPLYALIELARAIEVPEIHFLIIGEGEQKADLQEQVNIENLRNVTFLPFQNTEILPLSLAAGDLGVVTLDNASGSLSVPSKTFDLLSVGLPILAIAPKSSELYKLVNENDVGFAAGQTELQKLKAYIIELKENKKNYTRQSKNALELSQSFTADNAKKMVLIS